MSGYARLDTDGGETNTQVVAEQPGSTVKSTGISCKTRTAHRQSLEGREEREPQNTLQLALGSLDNSQNSHACLEARCLLMLSFCVVL